MPSIVLFVYRAVGVVLFERTDRRVMLFSFPNLFETWWLYVVIVARFWPRLSPHSVKSPAIALVLLLVPRLGQEYRLHVAEAKPWDFLKRQLGWE